MRTLLLLFSLNLVWSPPSEAQSQGTYIARFTVYGLTPGNYADIVATDSTGKSTPVAFKPKGRSQSYEATLSLSNPTLSFFKSENASEKMPIASVEMNPAVRDTLIIFQKTEASSSTYSATPVADSDEESHANTLRLLNLTGVEIVGVLDEQRFTLGRGKITPPSKLSGNKVTVSIAAEGSGRHHLLYRNTLSLASNNSGLLILRPPHREGSLRIGGHLLHDDLSTTKAQPYYTQND